MFCFGLGSGLVQGAAGVGGPPVVALVLSRPGDAETQRANVIGTVSALALSSPIPLWYYGLFTPNVLMLSVLLFPLFTLSAWAGERFFFRWRTAPFPRLGSVDAGGDRGDYPGASGR